MLPISLTESGRRRHRLRLLLLRRRHITCYLAVNPRRSPIARAAISNPSAAFLCNADYMRRGREMSDHEVYTNKGKGPSDRSNGPLSRGGEKACGRHERAGRGLTAGATPPIMFLVSPPKGGVLLLRRLVGSSDGQWPNGERHQYHKNQNAAQAPASVFRDRKRGH